MSEHLRRQVSYKQVMRRRHPSLTWMSTETRVHVYRDHVAAAMPLATFHVSGRRYELHAVRGRVVTDPDRVVCSSLEACLKLVESMDDRG